MGGLPIRRFEDLCFTVIWYPYFSVDNLIAESVLPIKVRPKADRPGRGTPDPP
jgi:hypothetical protein